MAGAKQLADELQSFLGDEYRVCPWLVDYTWDAITVAKGNKEVRIFTRDLTQITRPDGLCEYVETETIPN